MRLTGCIGWVEHIYIYRYVDPRASNSFFQPIDNAVNSDTVNVSGFDHLEPAADVVSHVTFRSDHWRPNSSMDRSVTNQAFLMSNMKKGAVVHTSVKLISQLKNIVRLYNTYA